MTQSAWLTAVGFEAPPALVSRVREVIDADASMLQLTMSQALLRASETLLAGVIARSDAGREVALDLLAADACVTWAFELEAGHGTALSTFAEGAMTKIAALAT